mmetsp:Transcript_89612/g.254000  ORF Transcript_89612/g.254000 Transcript_89612/m.254000 type:complete len:249 (-) Transcript_89612:321-1067(-)
MRLPALAQAAAADVPVEVQGPGRALGLAGLRLVLPPECQHVGVVLPPGEDGALLHGDEANEVLDLDAVVPAVLQAAQVEEFRALVDLRPEPVLHGLLHLAQLLVLSEAVQVSEHSYDTGETMHLQDVDELEGLELEPEGGVNEEQHQVRDLGEVQHRGHVLRALHDRQPALAAAHECDRAMQSQQLLLRIVFHEGVDQRGLADPRGSVHDDDERRRQLRVLVDLWGVVLLRLLLQSVLHSLLDATAPP